nr:FRG domain-containing protein [Desulfobacula sp.]
MKNHNCTIWGNIPEPENFEEIVQLALSIPKNSGRVRMWRGQGNIDWPIHSGAFRRLNNSSHADPDDMDIRMYEKTLLQHASHKGYHYINGRALSDLELLARLQHHGAATRLIDFSKNVLVALFFCVTNEIKKPGLLVGIHTDYLGGYEHQLDERSYDEIMDQVEKYDHSITWDPTGVTGRIDAQNSQFLYSKTSSDKRGSLLMPMDPDSVMTIAISSK